MISETVTRLQAELANFTTVDHAWNLEPVDDVQAAIPACWAFRGEDDSEPSLDSTACVTQLSTIQMHVFTVCDWQDLDARRDELMTALIGWEPTADLAPFEHHRGETAKIKGSTVWWLDIFITSRHLRG